MLITKGSGERWQRTALRDHVSREQWRIMEQGTQSSSGCCSYKLIDSYTRIPHISTCHIHGTCSHLHHTHTRTHTHKYAFLHRCIPHIPAYTSMHACTRHTPRYAHKAKGTECSRSQTFLQRTLLPIQNRLFKLKARFLAKGTRFPNYLGGRNLVRTPGLSVQK